MYVRVKRAYYLFVFSVKTHKAFQTFKMCSKLSKNCVGVCVCVYLYRCENSHATITLNEKCSFMQTLCKIRLGSESFRQRQQICVF